MMNPNLSLLYINHCGVCDGCKGPVCGVWHCVHCRRLNGFRTFKGIKVATTMMFAVKASIQDALYAEPANLASGVSDVYKIVGGMESDRFWVQGSCHKVQAKAKVFWFSDPDTKHSIKVSAKGAHGCELPKVGQYVRVVGKLKPTPISAKAGVTPPPITTLHPPNIISQDDTSSVRVKESHGDGQVVSQGSGSQSKSSYPSMAAAGAPKLTSSPGITTEDTSKLPGQTSEAPRSSPLMLLAYKVTILSHPDARVMLWQNELKHLRKFVYPLLVTRRTLARLGTHATANARRGTVRTQSGAAGGHGAQTLTTAATPLAAASGVKRSPSPPGSDPAAAVIDSGNARDGMASDTEWRHPRQAPQQLFCGGGSGVVEKDVPMAPSSITDGTAMPSSVMAGSRVGLLDGSGRVTVPSQALLERQQKRRAWDVGNVGSGAVGWMSSSNVCQGVDEEGEGQEKVPGIQDGLVLQQDVLGVVSKQRIVQGRERALGVVQVVLDDEAEEMGHVLTGVGNITAKDGLGDRHMNEKEEDIWQVLQIE